MINDKVVFLDMGNTLIHFHFGPSDDEKDELGLRELTNYLKQYSEKISYDEVKREFFYKWMNIFPERKKQNIEFPIEDFLNAFMKRYDIELSLPECIKAIESYYQEYKKHLHVEENILTTLDKIKERGYKIGIISNTAYYEEIIIDCFKVMGIHKYIDEYTFSYGLRLGKPDKTIFKVALEKMKVLPENAFMVGDKISSDIVPAAELGMKTIWLNGYKKEPEKGDGIHLNPGYEVRKIEDILEYI